MPSDTAAFKSVRKEPNLKDGLLQRGGKIIPPAQLRKDILLTAHQGHPGIVQMKATLRREYWWPCMVKQIERMVNSCPDCQRRTKSRGSPYSPKDTVIPRPETPAGEQWGLDISGSFYNGRCLVVLIDYASQFPEVLDTKDTTPPAIIRWMDSIWERYGYPSALVSDNGPQFTSKLFTDYL
ncbi:MAG: hypothetical protein GY696_31390, partial [Gammaproteobacteria bacterium]|nr:hypothetical protein [Gammaproteobacteria bacterium]